MKLRPYQIEAVERIGREWEDVSSTLLVMPTGTGKTQVFATLAAHRLALGRAMIIAHREELIFQAAHRVEEVSGIRPGIEMAEHTARVMGGLFDGDEVVVSTVQTQVAGRDRPRMERFDPASFSTLILDEAHHATAKTYRRIIDYYSQNPDLKILGVTATPDRHDEEALGRIFDTVAMDYELPDAIKDGWLVPIRQRVVYVDHLDLSEVRTTAADLNGGDLAKVLEEERVLHEMASPAIELAGGRKSLVFTATVRQAERLAEIFNRHDSGSARWICATTKKDERRQTLKDYAAGRFQFLVNVGIATEGFDEPSIECIIMGRPTKSRALYAQMVGRGTRSLTGTLDDIDSPELRRGAIARSDKTSCEVIDFTGNAGRHKLITAADILGGRYTPDIISAANKIAEAGTVDVMEALEEAEERKRREEEEERRRRNIKARARFSTAEIDPFALLDVRPDVMRGWHVGKELSDKQKAMLIKNKVDPGKLNYAEQRQILDAIFERIKGGLCTLPQMKLLKKYGWYEGTESLSDASKKISQIKAAGWRRPRGVVAVTHDG